MSDSTINGRTASENLRDIGIDFLATVLSSARDEIFNAQRSNNPFQNTSNNTSSNNTSNNKSYITKSDANDKDTSTSRAVPSKNSNSKSSDDDLHRSDNNDLNLSGMLSDAAPFLFNTFVESLNLKQNLASLNKIPSPINFSDVMNEMNHTNENSDHVTENRSSTIPIKRSDISNNVDEKRDINPEGNVDNIESNVEGNIEGNIDDPDQNLDQSIMFSIESMNYDDVEDKSRYNIEEKMLLSKYCIALSKCLKYERQLLDKNPSLQAHLLQMKDEIQKHYDL